MAVESKGDQFVSNHRENEGDAPQMKGGLCQNRFASQQRFGDPSGDTHSPVVVPIIPISEGDEEAGVRNSLHERENPLRLERFFGPRIVPAKRMKV